jgi:hypothetical protein
MEKIIDAIIGLIEVTVLAGALTYGSNQVLKYAHHQARQMAFEALKKPTPSLERFSQKLTQKN